MAEETGAVSRRWLLMKIGVAINGVVAVLIATPVIRYLLGPVRRSGGYKSWIRLGDVNSFPEGRDAASELRQSVNASLRWPNCQRILLGTAGAE